MKISQTMRLKKIDNFKKWRDRMKKIGKIKTNYTSFLRNGDFAELLGVTLGDGHICVYPRTEELRITSNSKNYGFIKRYSLIVEKVFHKKPSIIKSSTENATKISLYEKNISKRMGIPSGSRADVVNVVPNWILSNKSYILRYLRGLYEAEGSLSFHLPTYTYKFLFSNKNESMLLNVFNLMNKLGFHPHLSKFKVQISRKNEVGRAVDLIGFRKY